MNRVAARLGFSLFLAAVLAGCGEGAEEAHGRGYEEGYEQGQWDVCSELGRKAPAAKNRITECRGF